MAKPFFTDDQFTPTKFDSAADKAAFGNSLLHFILSGFERRLFTHKLYNRLMNTFGMIAHYNIEGFWEEWFSSTTQQTEFIRALLAYPCWGQPDYTYSDVERAVRKKIDELNLLPAYQDRVTAETRTRELALLASLQAKYRPAETVPVPSVPAAPAAEEAIQLSLIA